MRRPSISLLVLALVGCARAPVAPQATAAPASTNETEVVMTAEAPAAPAAAPSAAPAPTCPPMRDPTETVSAYDAFEEPGQSALLPRGARFEPEPIGTPFMRLLMGQFRGPLDRDPAGTTYASRFTAFRDCYAAAAARDPSLEAGAHVHFRVESSGRVVTDSIALGDARVRAMPTLDDRELAACITARVACLAFPAADGSTDVDLDVVFGVERCPAWRTCP